MPAFITEMVPPPKIVKDRSHVWQECTERYGRPWKEVKNEITNKRNHYYKLDKAWGNQIEEDKKKKAK